MTRSLFATLKLCALLVLTAAGALLSGPAGFGPEPQSAEAALLSQVKKLLASDAQIFDEFGRSVAVSGDTAVGGHTRRMPGAATPAPPTFSSATKAARATGAR